MAIKYSPKDAIDAIIAALVRGLCMYNGMDEISSEALSSVASGFIGGISIEKEKSVFSGLKNTVKKCFISVFNEHSISYNKRELNLFLESLLNIDTLEEYLHDDINRFSDRLHEIVNISDEVRVHLAEEILKKISCEIRKDSTLLAIDTNYTVHEFLAQYNARKDRGTLIKKQADFANEPIYGNPRHTLKKLFVEYEIEYRYQTQQEKFKGCWDFFDHYQYFGENRLLLMLGDYGAGKSSTLKLLASRPQTSQYVYISLRDILLFSSNIRDGINEYCSRKYNYSDIFANTTKHILLLDGFDELQQIMNESNETLYFRQIESLLDYENISIVLSSRGTQFIQTINITLYPQIYLSDFKEIQISNWIEKWKDANDQEPIITLEGIKKRDLLHVASNKLILYMIARIYDDELKDAKPYTRGYIYKLFIDWTISGKFKDDKTQQHIMPDLKEQEKYRKILQEIAYVMTIQGKEMITYEALSRALQFFQESELNALLYDVDVQLFTQHFFTISHDDYRCISFSHKSFRQYLLAEKLWKIWVQLSEGTDSYGMWYQFGRYGQLEKESFDFLNDFILEEIDIGKLQKINQLALRRCALFVNSEQYTKLLLENQNSKVLEAAECYSRSIILSTIAGIVNILSANRLSNLKIKYHQISAENIFMLCDYYLRGKNAYYIRNYDVLTQFLKQIRVKNMDAFRMRYINVDLHLYEMSDSQCSGGIFYTFNTKKTNLINVHWKYSNFSNCFISDGILQGVSFEHCEFQRVTFENVTFNNVIFRVIEDPDITFKNCHFIECYLEKCIIKGKLVIRDYENVEIELLALNGLDVS